MAYKARPAFCWNFPDVKHTHPHAPRQWPRSRLLAWPLVVVCGLAYLGSLAHFFLVRHRTCLEHGEVVHGAGAEARVSAVGLEPSEGVRIARADAAVAVDEADAHCGQVLLRRSVSLPGVTWEAGPAPVDRATGPRAPGVGVEPVARLRLAPKNSPPLA